MGGMQKLNAVLVCLQLVLLILKYWKDDFNGMVFSGFMLVFLTLLLAIDVIRDMKLSVTIETEK